MFSGSEQRASLSSALFVSRLSPFSNFIVLCGFAVFMLLCFAPGRAEAVLVKPPFREVLSTLQSNKKISERRRTSMNIHEHLYMIIYEHVLLSGFLARADALDDDGGQGWRCSMEREVQDMEKVTSLCWSKLTTHIVTYVTFCRGLH